jgi:hypothetical protein
MGVVMRVPFAGAAGTPHPGPPSASLALSRKGRGAVRKGVGLPYRPPSPHGEAVEWGGLGWGMPLPEIAIGAFEGAPPPRPSPLSVR